MAEIKRYRGDTAADRFVVKNQDGTVVNITGYTFKLTVSSEKNPPNESAQLYQLTGTIVDAPNGVVEFAPSTLQANQPAHRYYYDVQMTDTGTRITTLAKDVYDYIQDITK